MSSKKFPTKALLSNTACRYLQYKSDICKNVELQYDFTIFTLQLMEKTILNKENETADVYNSVIIILDVGTKILFKQKEFIKIRNLINTYIKITKKLSKSKIYLKFINIFKSIGEICIEFQCGKQLFQILKDNFSIYYRELTCICNSSKWTSEMQNTCNVTSNIFMRLIEYYCTLNINILKENLKEEVLIILHKVINVLGHIRTKTDTRCAFCSDCSNNKNLSGSISIMICSGKILKIFVENKIEVSYSLIELSYHNFEKCCAFIQDMKKQNCKDWKRAWTEVGIMIYNVAAYLYSSKHIKCQNFFRLLINNMIQIEEAAISQIFKIDVLHTSLICLSEISLELCEYTTAIMYNSLQILLCTNVTNPFHQWIKIKCKNKQSNFEENDFQHLTIACVLEQHEAEFKALYDVLSINLTQEILTNLLILELEQYKSIWPSKIPMMAVLKKLFIIAKSSVIVTTLIHTWGQNLEVANYEISDLIPKIIKKYKTDSTIDEHKGQKNLHLAFLYGMLYYVQTFKIRRDIIEEMNNTFGIPLDQLLENQKNECDLVTERYLHLEKFLKVIKHLNKSLDHFDISVSIDHRNLLNKYKAYDFVRKIAFEHRLHCNSLQSARAWNICLNISRIIQDDLNTLESISFILEYSDVHSELGNKLLQQAKDLVTTMRNIDLSESWKNLCLFHINISKMYLLNQNPTAGYEHLNEAFKAFENISKDSHYCVISTKLNFLNVEYLFLPCNLKLGNHDVNVLGLMSKTFNNITSYVNEEGSIRKKLFYSKLLFYIISGFSCPFTLTTLFEINYVVGQMYRWMCLPREVRCYCRDIITIAQKLVIPLRTTYFLVCLARADLLSGRLENCEIKLNDLSQILCLMDNSNLSTPMEDNLENNNPKVEEENILDLTEGFAEILLDCPQKSKDFTGSPNLKKPFKFPPFMNHYSPCTCFYCVSVEYKDLILSFFSLEAFHNSHTNNSLIYYKRALYIYKSIHLRSSKYNQSINKLLPHNTLQDLEDVLCETYCTLLLDYGNQLLRNGNIEKAESVNENLLNIFSKKKLNNLHLYNEALLQKIDILMLPEGNKCFTKLDSELSPEEDIEQEKTPENRSTFVKFIKQCSPQPNSPPQHKRKVGKCDFSTDFQNNAEKNKELTVPITKTMIRTPEPSCSGRHDMNMDLKITESDIDSDISVIPASPTLPMTLGTNFTSKTKYLTRKLRSEKKTNTVLNVEQQENATGTRKITRRKNLMKEWSKEEPKKKVNQQKAKENKN